MSSNTAIASYVSLVASFVGIILSAIVRGSVTKMPDSTENKNVKASSTGLVVINVLQFAASAWVIYQAYKMAGYSMTEGFYRR